LQLLWPLLRNEKTQVLNDFEPHINNAQLRKRLRLITDSAEVVESTGAYRADPAADQT